MVGEGERFVPVRGPEDQFFDMRGAVEEGVVGVGVEFGVGHDHGGQSNGFRVWFLIAFGNRVCWLIEALRFFFSSRPGMCENLLLKPFRLIESGSKP